MRTEAADIERELGVLLRLHRISAGLSCKDIAKLGGLPEDDIHRLERGDKCLSVQDLIQMSIALNLPLPDLMTQLETRLCLNDRICQEDAVQTMALMTSNRGRQAVQALAGCGNPKLVEALFDMIIASCMSSSRKSYPLNRAN